MQLVGGDVAVVHCHDVCITLHREGQFRERLLVQRRHHSPTLLVDGIDADVHKVLAVCTPSLSIGHEFQGHCLARGLQLVTRHHLAVLLAHCRQRAGLVRNVFPQDARTLFRVAAVLLHTEALAVEEEFYLIGIGVGVDRHLLAGLAVPIFRELADSHVDTVPLGVARRLLDDADMNSRFVAEHTLHEIGIGLGLQGEVEHALVPAFHGPAETLAQIVDGSPVGQSHHAVKVHLVEVRSHAACIGLALIEHLLRVTFHVTGEVHITVVVGVHLRLHGQVGRDAVRLNVAVTGVHGHGGQSRVIVAVEQFLLQLISCHAPIVERQVAVLLQLVA